MVFFTSYSAHASLSRIAALSGLALLAVTLSLHGWRARPLFPMFTDLAVHIIDADQLVHQGRIPDRGAVGSTMGRIPPGTTWLLAPGVLLFSDPRLFEVPTSVALFVLTLVGILLLGRVLLNETCAWIAVSLYAFSFIGLHFATSLWPRGHPVFVVWILYFSFIAVERSRPLWLLAAVVCYGFGTYVFVEIAPIAVVFLVALAARPSLLSWWFVALSLISVALMWWPYLQFQQAVSFIDVKRLASNNSIIPGLPDWCGEQPLIVVPASGQIVEFRSLDLRFPPPPKNLSHVGELFAYRLPAAVRSLFWNTHSDTRLGLIRSSAFSLLLLLGVSVSGLRVVGRSDTGSDRRRLRIISLIIAGAAAFVIVTFKLANIFNGRFDWNTSDSMVLFGLLAGSILTSLVLTAKPRHHSPWPSSQLSAAPSRTVNVLLLSALIVGQLGWSFIAPAESRRFMWLWPIQCLLVAFAICELCRCLQWRWRSLIGLALLLVCGFAGPAVSSRVRDWHADGWGGRNEPVIHLIDLLAEHEQRLGRGQADGPLSVSYDLPGEPFLLAANSVDRRYTIGMGYDLYLKFKHSRRQALQCADSYNPTSRYVIREARTAREYEARLSPLSYHSARPDDNRYVLLGKEGDYALFWKP